MNETYDKWYDEFKESIDGLGDNELVKTMDELVGSGRASISLNRKMMEKAIDVSWVEAIENGMIHLDNIVRNPGRTIVDVEEIVPIALSKKVTVESVKHLAQHTDLIQSVDKKTGKITPSKLLNVYKEESLATYENRFINTLIDRLYGFLMIRYQKLSQISKDEEVFTMDFETEIDDGNGSAMAVKLSIDNTRSLEARNDGGYTIWQRVEKLMKTIEGYKGSELCQTLGNNFVRPPIMRTNAIMKNVDMKACLALWQYILSYDKIGYEINIEDTAVKPEQEYIDDLYKLVACNLLLFKTVSGVDKDKFDLPELGTKKIKGAEPRIIKKYGRELLSGNYELHADEAVGYVTGGVTEEFIRTVPGNSDEIFEEINKAIEIEKNFYAAREKERLEQIAAEEEAERRRKEREERLEEKRRIEEAKREERERIKREKEEEAKRIQEMLEKRKAEIEAEERERERIEAERQARLEEERRLAEEARLAAEEAERIRLEKEKIAEQKKEMRTNLGYAEGVDTQWYDQRKLVEETSSAYSSVSGEEIDEAAAAMAEVIAKREAEKAAEKVDSEEAKAIAERFAGSDDNLGDETGDEISEAEKELAGEEGIGEKISHEKVEEAEAVMGKHDMYESPRTIAARMKIEAARREKERKEEERAHRLKAERAYYENKPFDVIRKQYSKNPIYAIPRFFMWLLFVIFGYIPKDTDNPEYKKILAKRAETKKIHEEAKAEREVYEVYYRKYSPDTKYRIRRDIADIKFKMKKRKAAKNKPKPVYVPPKRTAEEQAQINANMKKLYKKYKVGLFEKMRRKIKSMSRKEKERQIKEALGER